MNCNREYVAPGKRDCRREALCHCPPLLPFFPGGGYIGARALYQRSPGLVALNSRPTPSCYPYSAQTLSTQIASHSSSSYFLPHPLDFTRVFLPDSLFHSINLYLLSSTPSLPHLFMFVLILFLQALLLFNSDVNKIKKSNSCLILFIYLFFKQNLEIWLQNRPLLAECTLVNSHNSSEDFYEPHNLALLIRWNELHVFNHFSSVFVCLHLKIRLV